MVAVGTMACTSQELAAKGPTGTAMVILHVIEDKLWASGPKQILPPLAIESKDEAPGQASVDKEEEKTEEKPDGKPEEKEEVKLDEMQNNKRKEEGSGEEDNEEEKGGEDKVFLQSLQLFILK